MLIYRAARPHVVSPDDAELVRRLAAPGGPFDALCAAYDAELARVTAERDALARWKRWTECWAQLHMGSLDFEADSADERMVRRESLREYGDMLRYARTDCGRTMGDVADALGCTVAELSGVERSRNPPFDEATTRKLCAFLGIKPDPLLGALAKAEEALRE